MVVNHFSSKIPSQTPSETVGFASVVCASTYNPLFQTVPENFEFIEFQFSIPTGLMQFPLRKTVMAD